MATNYDLNNTGPEVQERLDQVMPNKTDISQEVLRAQGVEERVIFSQTWRDTRRQWRALQREGWRPDVVQLNVILKHGLLA